MTSQRVVAITGARGFIGSALCVAFAARGWRVRAGVRRPAEYTGPGEAFLCDLPRDLAVEAFTGAEVVIHAAWDMRFRDRRRALATNLGGSRAVFDAARRAGARVVFLSSCSAHAGALSLYGRTKLAAEQRLDPARDLILRPGLVVGPGGLFARIVENVRRAPLIPLFDGGRQPVQTISLAELCEGVVRAVESDHRGRVVLAHPEGIAFGAMLGLIAQQLGCRRLFVPISATPFVWAARGAERLGVTLPFSSENLLGLRSMVQQRSQEDLEKLGLELQRPVVVLRRGVRALTAAHHGDTKDTESEGEE